MLCSGTGFRMGRPICRNFNPVSFEKPSATCVANVAGMNPLKTLALLTDNSRISPSESSAGTDGFFFGRWLSLSSLEQEAWFQIFLADLL